MPQAPSPAPSDLHRVVVFLLSTAVIGAAIHFGYLWWKGGPQQLRENPAPEVTAALESLRDITPTVDVAAALALSSGDSAEENLARLDHSGVSGAEAPSELRVGDGEEPLPDSAEPVFVRGRVIDEAGHPVAGASVWGKLTASGRGISQDEVALRSLRDSDEQDIALADSLFQRVDRTAATDGQGRFTMQVRSGGGLALRAMSPSELNLADSVLQLVDLTGGSDPDEIELVLPYGLVVEGVVVDPETNPIPQAEVQVLHAGSGRRERLITDDEGGFEIDRVSPEHGIAELLFTRDGFRETARENVIASDSPLVVVMNPEGAILVDARIGRDGARPRAIVLGIVMMDPETETYFPAHSPPLNLQVAGDDLPVMLPLPEVPGEYLVFGREFDPTAGETTGRFAEYAFSMPEYEEQTIELQLDAGRTLEGMVVFVGTDIPVEGARVSALRGSVSWNRRNIGVGLHEATTGEDGRFRFESMSPGEYRLTARRQGLSATSVPAVTVGTESDPRDVTISMTGGTIVFGRVTGLNGQPVADAEVTIVSDHFGFATEQDIENPPTETTDDNGEYRFERAPVGEAVVTVRATLTAPNGEEIQREESRSVFVFPCEEKEVNFDLEPRVRLHGDLVFNGQRILETDRFGAFPDMRFEDYDDPLEVVYGVKNGPRFEPDEVDDYSVWVWPGRYHLRGSVHGINAPYDSPVFLEIDVQPSPPEQRVDLRFHTHDTMLVVDVGEEGASLMNGRVWIAQRLSDGRVIETVYREDIHSPIRTIRGLPAGEYRVEYRDLDGVRDSDWTLIGPNTGGGFFVPATDQNAITIGRWYPPGVVGVEGAFNLSPGFGMVPVMLDASSAISEPGVYEIRFAHQWGLHATVIPRGVALLVDGVVASEDSHFGWSGTDRREATYYVRLPHASQDVRLISLVYGHGGGLGRGLVRVSREPGGHIPLPSGDGPASEFVEMPLEEIQPIDEREPMP